MPIVWDEHLLVHTYRVACVSGDTHFCDIDYDELVHGQVFEGLLSKHERVCVG